MKEFLTKAKSATQVVATLEGKQKNRILNEMAEALLARKRGLTPNRELNLIYALSKR